MGEVGELGPYFKSAEILPFSDWIWDFSLARKMNLWNRVKILHHEGEHASDEV